MLPELLHAKYLKETTLPTGWSVKHATKANVRITTVFMTAVTDDTFKEYLKKEKNCLELSTKT